jgi:hypothetical protein
MRCLRFVFYQKMAEFKDRCVCIKFYFNLATTATEAFQMVKFDLARKQETELKHLIAFRVQK